MYNVSINGSFYFWFFLFFMQNIPIILISTIRGITYKIAHHTFQEVILRWVNGLLLNYCSPALYILLLWHWSNRILLRWVMMKPFPHRLKLTSFFRKSLILLSEIRHDILFVLEFPPLICSIHRACLIRVNIFVLSCRFALDVKGRHYKLSLVLR